MKSPSFCHFLKLERRHGNFINVIASLTTFECIFKRIRIWNFRITVVHRSTSPFRFGNRKEKKKLEKQKGLDEASSPNRLFASISPQSSTGTSFENLDPNLDPSPSATTADPPLGAGTTASASSSKKTKNPFKEFRKKPSPFSLNLIRSKKSSDKDIPCTASSTGGYTANHHSGFLHPSDSLGWSDSGTSPPGSRLSRSPPSPSQCKCRRCSILHLEECEPKEMNALFKFLRKSKVKWSDVRRIFYTSDTCLYHDKCIGGGCIEWYSVLNTKVEVARLIASILNKSQITIGYP